MHKIAVLDYRFQPDVQAKVQSLATNKIEFLHDHCPEESRIAMTADADIALVTTWDKVNKEYLDACPNLKYVGLCGTSTANIDLEELSKRDIAFSNIVSGDKESVPEFFFMQLVRLARGIGEYQWKPNEKHELTGKSIGIVGLGAVGQAFAHMAIAYKMNIAYFNPHRKPEWEEKGVKYLEMIELMKSSDIVVICSPTDVKVLGQFEFDNMKPASILVQANSGSPFEKQLFIDWIKHDGNYAMFDMSAGQENYQTYKDIPRVLFYTDAAGDTYESNYRRGLRAVENLENFLKIEV